MTRGCPAPRNDETREQSAADRGAVSRLQPASWRPIATQASGANGPWTDSAEAPAASPLARCVRLEPAIIRSSAKCELILLHHGELQARMRRKFKSVDAQLHKTAACCLSQATWAGAEEGRPGQGSESPELV